MATGGKDNNATIFPNATKKLTKNDNAFANKGGYITTESDVVSTANMKPDALPSKTEERGNIQENKSEMAASKAGARPKTKVLNPGNMNIEIEKPDSKHTSSSKSVAVVNIVKNRPEAMAANITYTGVGVTLLPTDMLLYMTVPVSSDCFRLSTHQGNTYVWNYKSPEVSIVDNSGKVDRALTVMKLVQGLTVHRDKLYLLGWMFGHVVQIFDVQGNTITSWKFSCLAMCTDACCVGDKIVMFCQHGNSHLMLKVFTLDGHFVKDLSVAVKLSLFSYVHIRTCAVGGESIIVSVATGTKDSQIMRINMQTESIVWKTDSINNPGGVACYADKFVMIVSTNKSTTTAIYILDINTGRYLGQITDPTERKKSKVYDLAVIDNTLIVPRYDEGVVLYYLLE